MMVHVLVPRVIFHVQSTFTWSPFGSEVVVDACRVVFVVGDVGSTTGAVRLGAAFGELTVVDAVAVLLPGVLSLGDETVALLLIVPTLLGAVTTIVMFGAAPGARLPERLHVTVVVPVQAQFVPVALAIAEHRSRYW